MRQITTASDKLTKKNVINRVSYLTAGFSVLLSELVAGSVVLDGSPFSSPTNGKRSLCKQAVVLTGSTTTAIKVAEGTHHFKVGAFIGTKTGGKAYAISSITNASGVDTLNVGTAIDTPTVGGFIYEMAAEAAATTSALKYEADIVIDGAFEVPSGEYVIYKAAGLLRADVVQNTIGSEYLATLKGVIEVKR